MCNENTAQSINVALYVRKTQRLRCAKEMHSSFSIFNVGGKTKMPDVFFLAPGCFPLA